MEKINLSKLNSINFDSKKISNNQKEAKPSETKRAEASSLDAMSNYGKAVMNLSFKGKPKEKPLSKDEKREVLKSVKEKDWGGKLVQTFDDEDIEQIIQDEEMYKKTETLLEIKDEEGVRVFSRDEISNIANNSIEIDNDFKTKASKLSNIKDAEGNRVFSGNNIFNIICSGIEIDDKFRARVSELSSVRGEKGERIFNNYDISKIATNEEIFKGVKKLLEIEDEEGKRVFNRCVIRDIVESNIEIDDDFKTKASKLSNIKDKEGEKVFDGYDIFNIVDSDIEIDDNFITRTSELASIKDEEGEKIFDGNDIFGIAHSDIKIDDDFITRTSELASIKDEEGERIFDGYDIPDIASSEENFERAKTLLEIKDAEGNRVFDGYSIRNIANSEIKIDDDFRAKVSKLSSIKDKEGKRVFSGHNIHAITTNTKYYDLLMDYINSAKEEDMPVSNNILTSVAYQEINKDQVKKLTEIYGKEKIEELKHNDLRTLCNLSNLYQVKDINEILMSEKKEIVNKFVSRNIDIFRISPEFKKDFPLIPTNQKEYCELLPRLVNSLGIEVKAISDEKINEFNSNMVNLSNNLGKLTDEEFNNLEISQDYTREEFISDTIRALGDLEDSEKQKVFDYFGFELKENENNKTGYTIFGYPANLNNGEKLSHIKDEKTKEVVEKLRPYVVKFTEQNKVECNNPEIQKELDNIVEVLPEIRTMIGKQQHGTHSFDVLKHSLKVIQKTVQNPKYEKLSEDNKRIILLSGLLHDISKGEGYVDKTHATESAFDSYYITKKLKLSRNDEIKLYTLSRNHEWLQYVNKKDLSNEEIEKREKEVAFHLQQEDLFNMAEIFTEADLKSVKDSDKFYDKFSDKFIERSKNIEKYISQLKTTQPILPTTKLPKASEIKKHITTVNSDGTTNIKGVYQDKDGLVVIKYNEVENWEEIGLPKGTVSKGIKIPNSDIDTGNIKFIAHGLDYSNQLSKFSALSLPDSDALLSVSYMERPESKFRMFRTQGVLLDVDSNYIYGGGETDSGSGCEKSISKFIKNYAYDGSIRHGDRKFISNLIKNTLNLNDEDYLKFIQENKNKSFQEIEPKDVREKLIHAFGTIISRTRRGNREYNEMYVSNPEVMGVFAYPENNASGDALAFAHNQKAFLTDYAKENDVPMVIFGK